MGKPVLTYRKWTAEEDRRLEDLAARKNITRQMIADRLDRTLCAISFRMHQLGVTLDVCRKWTAAEEQKFARLYVGTRLDMEEISQIMGRTVGALRVRSQILDLPPRQKAWSNPDLIMQIFDIPNPESA